MNVHAISTPIVRASSITIEELLDAALPKVAENSIIAITSKVVALCEGNVVDKSTTEKDALVAKEADAYLDRSANQYGFCISIKHNTLIASAGIDESNADGMYVLWPVDPMVSVCKIRAYLRSKFSLQNLGVIMTDSHVTPLRWGTVGTAIAYAGFTPLRNYVGTPDLFGRPLQVTRANIAEGLAAAAVLVMGEGNEGTPIALISDVSFVEFVDHDPTVDELASLAISPAQDLFAPLLTAVEWKSQS